MIKPLLVSLLLAGATRLASAQVANPTAAESSAVSLGLGFDHGGVLEAGYRQPFPLLDDVTAHGRLQIPSVPGLGEGGVEIGLTTGRVGSRGWGGTTSVSAAVRWVDGELLDLGQGGFVASAAAGWFRPRGLAAIELTWDHSLITYAHPTMQYRTLIYPDAESGLHGSGGGTLRAGVTTSLAVTDRIELGVRAGFVLTERLDRPAGPPIYALLGAAVRL